MERRKVLALGGGLLSITIAGCGGDETEFEEGNGGDDSEPEPEPEEEEEEEEEVDAEEALNILEHEMVREDEGGPAEQVSVEGRAENVSDQQLAYAEVRARFFNEDGDQLDSSLDNINDLDPGATWAFEILYLEIGDGARDVDSYDIGVGANF